MADWSTRTVVHVIQMVLRTKCDCSLSLNFSLSISSKLACFSRWGTQHCLTHPSSIEINQLCCCNKWKVFQIGLMNPCYHLRSITVFSFLNIHCRKFRKCKQKNIKTTSNFNTQKQLLSIFWYHFFWGFFLYIKMLFTEMRSYQLYIQFRRLLFLVQKYHSHQTVPYIPSSQ